MSESPDCIRRRQETASVTDAFQQVEDQLAADARATYDAEAGLREIMRRAAEHAATGETTPELQHIEQMRQRSGQRRRARRRPLVHRAPDRRARPWTADAAAAGASPRRLDEDIRQILDSSEAAAALLDKSRRSSAAEADLIDALFVAADDAVIDAQILNVDALLARAIMLGGDREQAEQAVAETCFETYQEEQERIRAPWGWAVQVMTRQLAVIAKRDMYRRDGERQHVLEVPVPPGMPPEERAEIALVMRALHDLPPREREAVVLYYTCRQNQVQIADILEIAQDKTGKYLRVAVRKLQRKLRVTAPPARPGGKLALPAAPAGTIAAMADQVGARLLAVTMWLAEGNRTDEHARERIRQRIDARLPDPRKDDPQ